MLSWAKQLSTAPVGSYQTIINRGFLRSFGASSVDSLTFGFWIRADTAATVFVQDNNQVVIDANGRLHGCRLRLSSGTITVPTVDSNLFDGQDHLVGIRFGDGTLDNHIDGIVVSSTEAVGTLNSTASQTFVGRDVSVYSGWLASGRMPDTELMAFFDAGRSQLVPSISAPTASSRVSSPYLVQS